MLPGFGGAGALVVVRYGVEAVDELRDVLEAVRRDVHRCERAFAAKLRRVENGAKAAQRAFLGDLAQALDDQLFRQAEPLGDVTEGAMSDRKAALQIVQEQAGRVVDFDGVSPLHAVRPSSAAAT